MEHQQPYIVQYVGFQTALDEDIFLNTWKPFASSFKLAGITQIDLYRLENREILTYISRNVWPAEAYFKNFPGGQPGAARTQLVNVLQFGGYWLAEDQQEAQKSMTLLFQRSLLEVEEESISCGRVTEQVPFLQALMLQGLRSDITSTNEQLVFPCSQMKSI